MVVAAVLLNQVMASPNWVSPNDGITTCFEGTWFGCLVGETPDLMPKSGRNYYQTPDLESGQVSKSGDGIVHYYMQPKFMHPNQAV